MKLTEKQLEDIRFMKNFCLDVLNNDGDLPDMWKDGQKMPGNCMGVAIPDFTGYSLKEPKQYEEVTITIKRPSPIKVEPEYCEVYYYLDQDLDVCSGFWDGGEFDQDLYERGGVFNSEEDAEEYRKVLMDTIPGIAQ